MTHHSRTSGLALLILCLATVASADPLTCDLTAYMAVPGLTAAIADDVLTVTWDGDTGQQGRLQFTVADGTPTIRELAVRKSGASTWAPIVTNTTADYEVVAGVRRATDQQLKPLRALGVPLTQDVIDRVKWEAFWDAPLNVPGTEAAHGGSTPPPDGVAGQPGLPRTPEEITRAVPVYRLQGCAVKTDGLRLRITFTGVHVGPFDGRLEYDVYKGTNLIRQAIIAQTTEPSVAYKYDAGLKGLTIESGTKVVWRTNTSNQWVDYHFGGAANQDRVPLKTANRLIVAEGPGGSLAAFPPPHNFFWARETEFNLGYNWYRKDSATSYGFGVRQAEGEEAAAWEGHGPEERQQNFALYSARPGTWQRMAVFFYVSAAPAADTAAAALALTRNDHYKPLPGYQVMATHFHTGMVRRLQELGSLDQTIPDFDIMKAAGVNIFAPIDSSRATEPEQRFALQADYYDAARRHSDSNFLIMPNEEDFSGRLGGHNDLLYSHPVYWVQGREPGQPLVETHPKYGKVYHIGTAEDEIEMATREHILIYMPHPRSKGSTGYPDAVKDKPTFQAAPYRGIGMRWGMGVDGSEIRLCEYRCQAVLDDMNNWVADLPVPLKFFQAITETYQKGPGDDIYANNPVNYVKLDRVPVGDDWSPITDAMTRGDYFWTSGEVLIPSYRVEGSGASRTIAADVEWTFPLDFVEVVWGDGEKVDRKIVSTTDLPPFGTHHFEIPFDATGKKWVRFAAWDAAGNGAMVQPIRLTTPSTSAQR